MIKNKNNPNPCGEIFLIDYMKTSLPYIEDGIVDATAIEAYCHVEPLHNIESYEKLFEKKFKKIKKIENNNKYINKDIKKTINELNIHIYFVKGMDNYSGMEEIYLYIHINGFYLAFGLIEIENIALKNIKNNNLSIHGMAEKLCSSIYLAADTTIEINQNKQRRKNIHIIIYNILKEYIKTIKKEYKIELDPKKIYMESLMYKK